MLVVVFVFDKIDGIDGDEFGFDILIFLVKLLSSDVIFGDMEYDWEVMFVLLNVFMKWWDVVFMIILFILVWRGFILCLLSVVMDVGFFFEDEVVIDFSVVDLIFLSLLWSSSFL